MTPTLRERASYYSNYLALSQLILPSIGMSEKNLSTNLKRKAEGLNLHCKIESINTSTKNCTVECTFITPKNQNIDNQNKIWSIEVPGNSTSGQELANSVLNHSQHTKMYHTVCLNFRGTFGRPGKAYSPRLLADDIVSVVQYLINNEGADASNIYIKAHSMGAAIATLATHKCHFELNLPVKLFHCLSFSSTGAVAYAHSRGLVSKSSDHLLHAWRINVTPYFLELPTNCCFIMYGLSKQEFQKCHPNEKSPYTGDAVIPYPSTLMAQIRTEVYYENKRRNQTRPYNPMASYKYGMHHDSYVGKSMPTRLTVDQYKNALTHVSKKRIVHGGVFATGMSTGIFRPNNFIPAPQINLHNISDKAKQNKFNKHTYEIFIQFINKTSNNKSTLPRGITKLAKSYDRACKNSPFSIE